jgi:riboflavin kinase / FMN adenylyltransferase
MQIVRHLDDPGLSLSESVVTLGNFDGIHLGHQALIGGAVTEAKKLTIPSVVLTFEPHPRTKTNFICSKLLASTWW